MRVFHFGDDENPTTDLPATPTARASRTVATVVVVIARHVCRETKCEEDVTRAHRPYSAPGCSQSPRLVGIVGRKQKVGVVPVMSTQEKACRRPNATVLKMSLLGPPDAGFGGVSIKSFFPGSQEKERGAKI
jgi:hypothetical protein